MDKQETAITLDDNIKKAFKNFNSSLNFYSSFSKNIEKELKKILDMEELTLPIDIRKVASKLNFTIIDTNLNILNNDEIIGKMIFRANSNNENERVIYVQDDLSEYDKRYVIAHEIGHYFIFSAYKENMESFQIYIENCCDTPKASKSQNELLSDLIAIFLLIPISNFKAKYIDYENKYNKYEDLWLSLSNLARIPYYKLIRNFSVFEYIINYNEI